MSTRIRVLVVDDHDVVAEGLRGLLAAHPDLEVTGVARNGRDALERVREQQPDVVLMDVSMPELNGIDAARRIREEMPHTRVVMLSMHSDAEHVQQALHAGVSGYVLKRAAAREVVDAVRAAHAGARYLTPELGAMLAARGAGEAAGRDPLERLSAREREVLQQLAESRSVQEIAARLELSPKTVETYRARVMEKLEIHDLAGLVRFAVQRGLISLE